MTMRVLMTCDTVGGVWTYALELADALAPHEAEVHLATMGRRMSADQRADVARSSVAAVHESDFALEWQPGSWPDVERAGEWLLDIEASLRPDVVHVNGYAHAALPWRGPVVVVAHSDVLSWWHAVHAAPAPPEWGTYQDRVAAGLAAADAVVAPTADVASCLARWYGCRACRVIASGRRGDWVHPTGKERLVLGAGRVWDAAKNLAMLDRVADHVPWPVLIAGEADCPNAPGRLRPAARLLGRLPFEELSRWLLRASIFVLPARYEPFGLGPLEAAQAGCALVLGDIGSLREVWADGAVFVRPDAPDDLVAALRRLIDDPEHLQEMSARARERAQLYRPTRMARDYLEVYRRLPARAGGTR